MFHRVGLSLRGMGSGPPTPHPDSPFPPIPVRLFRMRILTAFLCLTFVVLLFSAGEASVQRATLACKGERHLSASYTQDVKVIPINLTITINPVSEDKARLTYSYHYPPQPRVLPLSVCDVYSEVIICSEDNFTNGNHLRREVKLNRMTGALQDFQIVKTSDGKELGDSQVANCRVTQKQF